MIVATAGHVDHGKTSLVRALTHVDTDRLEEEKRRGMSIDLGFAYADFGLAEPIGFVDVPGHERFVRNMLAGVAAIDCVLLVIAADDGPMPQTLEHLAILELLGFKQSVVALTKVDRVDAARVAEVTQEIRALLASTGLKDAAILPVVATTGVGVDALREHLVNAARTQASAATGGNFRLAIDRAFSLSGAGLVVTGAVYSGRAEVGDLVILSPHGIEARIRSIHAQNRLASCALAGQRCALNLSGLELRKVRIERGDWALAANIHSPTQRLDVELKLLASEARHLSDGAPVQLHLAAASIPARVVLLDAKTLAAGRAGLAQLVLDQPIAALHGDRFVLRDQAAQRTIGGGRVLDPFGTARGRAKPARLAELDALGEPSAQASLRRLLNTKSDGVDLPQIERARNLNDAEQQVLRAAVELQLVTHHEHEFAVSTAQWRALRERFTRCMVIHHQRHPERIGANETELLSATLDSGGATPESVASDSNNYSSRSIVNTIRRAALRSLIAERVIVRDGLHLRVPEHRAQLSAKDQILFDRVSAVLRGAGLRPPIIGDLAKTLDVDLTVLQAFAQRASHSGHLAAVAANRFYLPDTVAALVQVARELAAQAPQQGFDAAAFRDKSGIGRNLTIQVLEFLDRNGFTRFARERRWMVELGVSQE